MKDRRTSMRGVREIPILLTVASIVMFIAPGLARPEPQSQPDTFLLPWIWPPVLNQEIQQCWSSFASIQGCWEEIFTSCLTFQMSLGPKCCNAINQLNENCVNNIFHVGFLHPFLPLVKDYCAPYEATDPPAQADQSPPTPVKQLAPPPSEDVEPNFGSNIAQSPKGRDALTPDQEISPSPSEEDEPKSDQGEEPDASSPDEAKGGIPDSPGEVDAISPDQGPIAGEANLPTSDEADVPESDQSVPPSPSEENVPKPSQGSETLTAVQ
ncbi:hypothetical protein NE237_026177 [Protea cynaroides]|uniref:Prolamin-like domain-containing protein n=1 Tax=Protea cynaroides TaxID=273540 RepID=A0A9Q0H5M8_9MAGN|nr:hypothetical protein NE237_026177 [Protea cynaroides]